MSRAATEPRPPDVSALLTVIAKTVAARIAPEVIAMIRKAVETETDANGRIDMVTAAQAAKTLNINQNTLAKWRCAGGGPPYIRIGTRVFYRVSVLSEWQDANTNAHTSEEGAS